MNTEPGGDEPPGQKKETEMKYQDYYLEIYNPDYYMGDSLPIRALTDESAMMHARSLTFLLIENTIVSVKQFSGDGERLVGSVTNKQVIDNERKSKAA